MVYLSNSTQTKAASVPWRLLLPSPHYLRRLDNDDGAGQTTDMTPCIGVYQTAIRSSGHLMKPVPHKILYVSQRRIGAKCPWRQSQVPVQNQTWNAVAVIAYQLRVAVSGFLPFRWFAHGEICIVRAIAERDRTSWSPRKKVIQCRADFISHHQLDIQLMEIHRKVPWRKRCLYFWQTHYHII